MHVTCVLSWLVLQQNINNLNWPWSYHNLFCFENTYVAQISQSADLRQWVSNPRKHNNCFWLSYMHPPLYHQDRAGFSSRAKQMTAIAASVAYQWTKQPYYKWQRCEGHTVFVSATNVVPLPTLALYAAKAEVESLEDLEYLLCRVCMVLRVKCWLWQTHVRGL